MFCSTFIIDLYSMSGNTVTKTDWLDDMTFLVLSTDNILRLLVVGCVLVGGACVCECVCVHMCVRTHYST